jgi:hypothetical protein
MKTDMLVNVIAIERSSAWGTPGARNVVDKMTVSY